MARLFFALLTSLLVFDVALSFPSYGSLAGLSARELDDIIPQLAVRAPKPPPGPLKDTRAKLVNDKKHPWKPAGKNDIRGVCPGLNTLASHGWLPRNGIATPAQIIEAVQEGFNMGNDLAKFVTYAAHLVDGNLLTDLLSIGGPTHSTGPAPPAPAIAGGLNTHAVFEGDASTTRGDAFFGDNHSFNETLFDKFTEVSNKFGDGFYDLSVAAELRFQRIQDSIATNPQFSLVSPRYFTAYAESVFPVFFFTDGRKGSGKIDMDVARGFFQNSRMPDDFFRSNTSQGLHEVGTAIRFLFSKHPTILPGGNNGTINSYTVDPNSATFGNSCKLYEDFVNITVRSLYPHAKGPLLKALNKNLDFFYSPFADECTQVPAFV